MYSCFLNKNITTELLGFPCLQFSLKTDLQTPQHPNLIFPGLLTTALKEELDDTAKGILEDKKFLADLEKDCGTKGAEHEENMKLRSQELLALADTIKGSRC